KNVSLVASPLKEDKVDVAPSRVGVIRAAFRETPAYSVNAKTSTSHCPGLGFAKDNVSVVPSRAEILKAPSGASTNMSGSPEPLRKVICNTGVLAGTVMVA